MLIVNFSTGAPHAHILLYLVDEEGNAPPTLFDITTGENSEELNLELFKSIEETNDDLYSSSLDEAKCQVHENADEEDLSEDCESCKVLKELVKKYQSHVCTFSCHKKHKFMKIHKKEGLAISETMSETDETEEIIHQTCRFNFPRFPIDKTTLIFPIPKNEDTKESNRMKEDLRHIKAYLIRRTQFIINKENEKIWKKFESMTFNEFLQDLGFHKDISPDLPEEERNSLARKRYINALRADVNDSGLIIKKRSNKDVYINNFNLTLMPLLKSNHDIQNVINPRAVANYVTNYLTKNEGGTSKLLKTLEEETRHIEKFEQLKKFAYVLDKSREASIQECVYQLGGLPMSKFSIRVKYISTTHPNQRDGLLKSNIEDLEENEPIFHKSIHQYYELRPSNEEDDSEDWDQMTLSEFVAYYEISLNPSKKDRPNYIAMQDNVGFIYRRTETAILRYYLRYEEPEDLAAGLLILFYPFRNEIEDIHNNNPLELINENKDFIEGKRQLFEKNQNLVGLIEEIQKLNQENEEKDEDGETCEEELIFEETTSEKDIQNFLESAKKTAKSNISSSVDMVIPGVESIRERSILLNRGQRKLFQDLCERFDMYSTVEDPIYLFLSGEAGVGKSWLLKLIIDTVKFLQMKSGDDLSKPKCITMAPTANAAMIVGGKTIESALAINPKKKWNYVKASDERHANMKFLYDEVEVVFVDEISMVGCNKLTTINFRMQDYSEGNNKTKFMGNRSFIACGDLR